MKLGDYLKINAQNHTWGYLFSVWFTKYITGQNIEKETKVVYQIVLLHLNVKIINIISWSYWSLGEGLPVILLICLFENI